MAFTTLTRSDLHFNVSINVFTYSSYICLEMLNLNEENSKGVKLFYLEINRRKLESNT